MPFREPRRSAEAVPASRFKNVSETDDFRLQKRRKRTFATHKYRIILVVPRAGVVAAHGRRLPVYELAHSNDLDELRRESGPSCASPSRVRYPIRCCRERTSGSTGSWHTSPNCCSS